MFNTNELYHTQQTRSMGEVMATGEAIITGELMATGEANCKVQNVQCSDNT